MLLGSAGRPSCAIVAASSEEPLWVLGDASSISNVLMNICLNAMDAMPRGGTLTLGAAAPQADWVEVTIEDTGEGMAPEILARATEPFFTTKPVGSGTGLGLSMCHGVIKAHGGTLDLASEPGPGHPGEAAPAPDRRTGARPRGVPGPGDGSARRAAGG